MSKSHSKDFEGKGLKGRVIFSKSFGYSRNFTIYDKLIIHPYRLQRDFPDMEKNKVTKKISEDVSIDYYFLNTEKVLELLKNSAESLGLSKSTHLRQKKIQKLIENF
jgi:hypothetical protein